MILKGYTNTSKRQLTNSTIIPSPLEGEGEGEINVIIRRILHIMQNNANKCKHKLK